MNPYIALTRPGNVVLTAVAVVAGSYIAAGDNIFDFQVEIMIASLAAMMLVGGGNALNDYNDRELGFAQLNGKELSYNNYNDIFASLDLLKSIKGKSGTVVIKHANPCGVSQNKDPLISFNNAYA